MSKITFSDYEQSSLMVEVLMQEIKEDNTEKINTVFDLLAFLYREKVRVLKLILATKDQSFWKEVKEIDAETNEITEYIQLLTTNQITQN